MLIVSFGVGRLTFQIIINIGKRPPMPTSGLALADPLEPLTTGSFPALQFNPSQKPFVAFGIVPLTDGQTIEIPARYLPLKPK